MAWKSGPNAPLGYLVPGNVDTTEIVPVGTIAKFFDDTQGEGTFIYLPGVASVANGDCVVYNLTPAGEATVRTLSGTHLNKGRPVAFATAAIVASTFGWFQIAGVAVASVLASFASGATVFLTTTAGNVDDAAVNGCQVLNCVSSSAIDTPLTGKAYLTINHPFIQGQTT